MPLVKQAAEFYAKAVRDGKGEFHCPQPKIMEHEAVRRIRNKEKAKRIVISCDEESYSQFQVRREAWMRTLGSNPTLFMTALDECMEEFDLLGWVEANGGEVAPKSTQAR